MTKDQFDALMEVLNRIANTFAPRYAFTIGKVDPRLIEKLATSPPGSSIEVTTTEMKQLNDPDLFRRV